MTAELKYDEISDRGYNKRQLIGGEQKRMIMLSWDMDEESRLVWNNYEDDDPKIKQRKVVINMHTKLHWAFLTFVRI